VNLAPAKTWELSRTGAQAAPRLPGDGTIKERETLLRSLQSQTKRSGVQSKGAVKGRINQHGLYRKGTANHVEKRLQLPLPEKNVKKRSCYAETPMIARGGWGGEKNERGL